VKRLALAVATACLGVVPACRSENVVRRLDPSLGRMQVQPRYDPYAESPFFADRSAMRAPPAGTEPYSLAPRNDALTDGSENGKDVTAIPLPLTLSLVERGQADFDVVCAACHGVAGDGDAVVAGFMARKPPPLTETRVRALAPGALYRVIRDGYGLMPAYGTHLDVAARWAVVAYVEALERSRHAVAARLPPDAASALARSTP
jgi:mono/diheme cytochrome c family protein